MLQFREGAFDVVLDKGGLDALMGEESPESREAGEKLLKEAARVLGKSGCYLCVTLAQSHVLSKSCQGEFALLCSCKKSTSLHVARRQLIQPTRYIPRLKAYIVTENVASERSVTILLTELLLAAG